MKRGESIVGMKFNRLTVVNEYRKDGEKHRMCECVCDCGNTVTIRRDLILNGNNKSCGCMWRETAANKLIKANTKHGDSDTRLYRIWKGMKYRCSAKGKPAGRDYADRGVCVCTEWDNFDAFREWAMNNGYSETLTIDRIDSNGNYEPNNCRWITIKRQQRNRRDTILINDGGEVITLKEACELRGMDYNTVYQRIYRLNWDVDKALSIC